MPKVIKTEVEVRPTEDGGVLETLSKNVMGSKVQNLESDARLKKYAEGEGFLPMMERGIRKIQEAVSGDTMSKKKGGSVKKTESKGKDWHGFGHSKTGGSKY